MPSQPLEISQQELIEQFKKRNPLEYENAVVTVTAEKLAKRNAELEAQIASPDQDELQSLAE